ncbi:hypothetical protein BX666DRAFT_1899003 [Dichotomocladium elegans]|nr:hypothetical protein BX666DRAFT_1899003 [Dichotomocladium elegans]
MSAPAISMHPFNLTLAEIARQCSRERNQNHLTCTLCKTRLYHTWEHAALWRSDPNVEIQCNYKLDRHHSYTLDTYLVNHVMAVLRNGFRGPLLDRDGYEKSDESLKEYETLCKELCESLETRKFRLLRNPDALYEALLSNGAELDRKKRTKGKYKKFAEELVQLLRARYEGNPTPEFSLDLIQAVLRLNEFVESIAETPSLHQPESIAYSIHRYYEFLQVYKTSKRPIVPNIDMDLVWHLHMLHPQTYRRSMMGFMQKIPNHDAIISPCGLDSHLEETRRMWKTFRSNPVQPQPVANPRPDPEPKKENKKFSLLRITKKPKIPFNNTKKTGTTLNYISGTFAPTVFSKPTRRGNKVGTITDLGSETSAISFHNWRKYIIFLGFSICSADTFC